jgi:hypothetical protein
VEVLQVEVEVEEELELDELQEENPDAAPADLFFKANRVVFPALRHCLNTVRRGLTPGTIVTFP